jgi:acetyl esterase/lipase/HEAT repeat protein
VPLSTLGKQTYQGYVGGLYAEGRNEPWGAHADALRRVHAAIGPLDCNGKPDPHGKIVVVGIGASVCRQVFDALQEPGPKMPGISPAVVFVNCAKGGHDVNNISDPARRYWESARASVEKAGFSLAQVQVAWYQSDDLRDQRDDFPGRPQRLAEGIAKNMRELKQHFPNTRICYHSARHTTAFMPNDEGKAKHAEPRPYHVGWAVKWLIEEQAAGKAGLKFDGPDAKTPLLAWATYFWTDADQPRHDGYRWTPADVAKDGVHLSDSGRPRIAQELLGFWRTDLFARSWFAANGAKASVTTKSPSAPPTIATAPSAPPARPEATQIYKRPGDRDLKITLTFPKDWRLEDRRPALVFFYNGGWKQSGANRQFSEQADYFARRGLVCGRADYREKSQDGITSVKCIEDIFSAIRWLRAHAAELGVDPKRIAAAGGSGSIHLLASVRYAGEIHAKDDDLTISPTPGALFLFDSDLDVLEPAKMRRLLTGTESPEARQHFPPTIIFYGGRDALMPYLDDFVTQAKKAGLPIEPFVEEDGLHGAFKFSPWLEKTTARMDERLRELGFLKDTPRVELPAKSKPPGVDQRSLENQARWLELHKSLEKSRRAVPEKKGVKPPAPAQPEAAPAPPPSRHIYKALGERKLQLAVHHPPGWRKEDRRPALLCFEGGGENPKDKSGQPYPLAAQRAKLGLPVVNDGPGRAFVPTAEHFAKLGLVCIRVEYRKRKTDGVLPADAVADAASAIRWVRAHAGELGLDPARVVACGSSGGGHLAASLAALAEFDAATDDCTISRRPDALILHSPLLDFLEGGTRNTTFLSALDNDRALGQRLSPARHWSKAMPPTLLFTGRKEPVFDSLCTFAAKWQAAGQRLELVTGEGGHVYSLTEKALGETLARMEAFLKSIGFLQAKPALGASVALAAQEKAETVMALAGRLQAKEFSARAQAALALVELGRDAQEAFPSLVQALADDEALDCVVAAQAFYATPRPAQDAPLLAQTLKEDTKARVAAAWELSRIGPSAGGGTARALIEALANPDKHERNFVVVALATTGPQTHDAVPALLDVLRDLGSAESPQNNYKYPRAAAAIAIGMIGTEARECVPALAEILTEKGSWEYQRAANCFALGRIGPGASNALPALKQALQDASPIVRAHAARAIQAIAPWNDSAASTAATTQETDVPALMRTLASGPGRIRSKVVEGLRALGEFAGAARPIAKKGSRRAAPPVHESISLAIGYLDWLPQPPSPEEIARQEKAGTLSDGTKQYLMALGGVQQSIAPVLLEALAQGEQDPRVIAVRRLAAVGPAAREAIPVLRATLADADWIIRREAFLALHRIEGPAFAPSSAELKEQSP